jgi:hypothetical protein
MSKEKVKEFNDILNSFLIQVSPIIGTTYQNYFENLIKYNSLLPIEQFLVNCLPVREQILQRDESFFYDEERAQNNFGNDEYKMNEIFKLKNIYKNLDEESKSNVWDIFQALLILGEEYLVLNQSKYVK